MLHIITIATDKAKVADLLASADVYKTPIEVIMKDTWNGYIDKIKEMKSALSKYKDDDILCFVDAYDVICSATHDKILKAFHTFNAPLVFSTELNCFPPHLSNRYQQIQQDKKNPTRYNYVNSGGYIGYKKEIEEFLNWKHIDEITEICKVGGDQTYFAEYYLSNVGKVALDYKQEIFQNMFFVGWNELLFVNSRVYNKTLQTSPCFLHFNGQSYGATNSPNIMIDLVKILQKGEFKEMGSLNQALSSWYYPRPQI
jgi:hypothetical protein